MEQSTAPSATDSSVEKEKSSETEAEKTINDPVGERSRSRSRSPIRNRAACQLFVTNLPYDLRWQELKALFNKEVGGVFSAELYMDENNRPKGCALVEMETEELAKFAVFKLNRYEINNRKMVVKENKSACNLDNLTRESRAADPAAEETAETSVPDLPPSNAMQLEIPADPEVWGDTYGLSVNFLQSLGIKPPLTTQVIVSNINCTANQNKLKQIFRMAGRVREVEMIIGRNERFTGSAVIDYDHPVEAIQAVSLFNNQQLYDRKITVEMKPPDTLDELPAGLKTIGIGLGPNGRPLRDIALYLPKQSAQPPPPGPPDHPPDQQLQGPMHPNHMGPPNPMPPNDHRQQGPMPGQTGPMSPNSMGPMHPNDPRFQGPGPMHPDQIGPMHPNDPRFQGQGPMHPDQIGPMHPNDPRFQGPGPMHPDQMRPMHPNDSRFQGPGPMHPDQIGPMHPNDPRFQGPGPMHLGQLGPMTSMHPNNQPFLSPMPMHPGQMGTTNPPLPPAPPNVVGQQNPFVAANNTNASAAALQTLLAASGQAGLSQLAANVLGARALVAQRLAAQNALGSLGAGAKTLADTLAGLRANAAASANRDTLASLRANAAASANRDTLASLRANAAESANRETLACLRANAAASAARDVLGNGGSGKNERSPSPKNISSREKAKDRASPPPAKSAPAKPPPPPNMKCCDTIIVENLPGDYTWQELQELFREAGDIKFAEMRGSIGLVRLSSEWEALRAVSMYHLTKVSGKQIDVRLF